jgi:hypothetical protein
VSDDPDIEKKLLNLITDLGRLSKEKYFSLGLNIFEAAGLYRQEIRHSNVLAFLLRPQEKHGLGDTFLKKLIQKAMDNSSGESPISALTVALSDFSDALVHREWRNIDLVVESASNKLILAIENKIGSSEGASQLSKYENTVGSEFPGRAKLYCYLTEDGEPASNERWSPISYSNVIDALQEARDHHSSNLTTEATIVIDHYIDVIRRNIVPDQALIDQCRKLYNLHRDALDLIIRYGEVSAFNTAAEQFFKLHVELTVLRITSAFAAFLPTTLFDIVPEIEGTNWWGQARPLVFWFILTSDGRFGLVIEVGPLVSARFNRETLVKQLLQHFKSGKKITPKFTPKFTRVYSEYTKTKLSDDQLSDPDEIQKVMNSLYENLVSKHLIPLTKILRSFFVK